VTVFERLYDVENVTGSGHDDGDTSKILAILEDYTDNLVTGDLLGSVVLTEV